MPESVRLTAVASPVIAGEFSGAFKSKATRVAFDTGFKASDVLSTFESPTEDFVSADTAVDILVSAAVPDEAIASDLAVATFAVVASREVSAIPCIDVVSDS